MGLYFQVRSYKRKLKTFTHRPRMGGKYIVSSIKNCHLFLFQVPQKMHLNFVLNELGLLESLMSEGSLFHSLGPREEMVLWPLALLQ